MLILQCSLFLAPSLLVCNYYKTLNTLLQVIINMVRVYGHLLITIVITPLVGF